MRADDQKLLDELSGQFRKLPPVPNFAGRVDPLPDYLSEIRLSCGTDLRTATLAMVGVLCSTGLDVNTSAMHCGFIPAEMTSAMERHPSVLRALNRAWATNVAWWVRRIREAAEKGDLKATQFYLERSLPSLFAEVKALARKDLPPMRSAAVTPESGPVENLSDEELIRLAESST